MNSNSNDIAGKASRVLYLWFFAQARKRFAARTEVSHTRCRPSQTVDRCTRQSPHTQQQRGWPQAPAAAVLAGRLGTPAWWWQAQRRAIDTAFVSNFQIAPPSKPERRDNAALILAAVRLHSSRGDLRASELISRQRAIRLPCGPAQSRRWRNSYLASFGRCRDGRRAQGAHLADRAKRTCLRNRQTTTRKRVPVLSWYI
jgi:hypothetical protein